MVGTGEKIAMDCFGEALNLAAPPAARGDPACALRRRAGARPSWLRSRHIFFRFFLNFVIVKCIILKFVIVIVM